MIKKLLLFTLFFSNYAVFSQLVINNPSDTNVIAFSGFSAAGFSAAGFSPTPSAGQLSSHTWSARGFSDGNLYFGGTAVTGDFARGTSMGGVTTGGIYAFVIGGDTTLGVQPIGTDFTPGSFILKMQNNTGFPINQLNIAYTLWELNNEDRSNYFNLEYATDTNNWITVNALNHVTNELADVSPAWVGHPKNTSISGFSVPNGDYLYLRWISDDVSGAGSRDELALDDIQINVGIQEVVADFLFISGCVGDTTFFTDQSSSFNGNILTWEWDFGDGGTSSVQNPNYLYSTGGSFSVSLIVTDDSSKTDTVIKTVSIVSPDATITIAGPFCIDDTLATFLAVDTGGIWSGPGITDSIAGTFDPAVAGSGTHDIIYAISGTCGDTDTVSIVVHNLPTVTASVPSDTVCLNAGTVDLTENPAGGSWSGNGIINSVTGEFDPAVASTGNHILVYTFTDINGCQNSDSVSLYVKESSDATITVAGPFCIDDSIVALLAADTGGVWSGSGITDAAAGIFNPAVAGVGTHEIIYTLSAPAVIQIP